jgi:hypothetical protein
VSADFKDVRRSLGRVLVVESDGKVEQTSAAD